MYDIEQVIKTLEPRRPKQTILYVNSCGYELFNFALIIGNLFPTVKFWTYIPHRIPNFIYVSLFQKHGLFKLKIHTDGRRFKYELINGTTLIGKSDSIESLRHFIKLNEQSNG